MTWVLIVLLMSGSIDAPRLETKTHRFATEAGCLAAQDQIHTLVAIAQSANTGIWERRGAPENRPHVSGFVRCVFDGEGQ